MPARTIHLVFKTHLDIGFTDHAEKVRQLYHTRFIPQAIDTGQYFYAEDPETPKFIWTTGAWLIHDHLATRPKEDVERLERAIAKGIIRWHGLPFTTHTELMSPALFEAGLSYAQELDKRFGKTTIAAKMTDVPGHTLGIVPLMAKAGIKFLHLGVNSACPVPGLPPIFRWRAPDGSEIVVMYQNSYGATHLPEGLADGLSFAHTNDNMGPQAIHQTVEIYRALAHAHPDAKIRAAALDDYGTILWDERERFPVIETEIGDSWIHGAAADPVKAARFRALQQLYDQFATEGLSDQRRAFGRGLTLVAEHTCGVDIKTFLRDETAWDRDAFEKARHSDYRFGYCKASWAEQRAYLEKAATALAAPDQARVHRALAALEVPPVLASNPPASGEAEIGGWRIMFDRLSGDIVSLESPGGTALTGRQHGLMGYRHESYDARDMATHLDSYLVERPEWAILDHDKPGLIAASSAHSASWAPALTGTARNGNTLILNMAMADQANAALGAPRRIEYRFTAHEDALEIALVLRGKPANRMPEAGFFSLTPEAAQDWRLLKTGLWHKAEAVAPRGGGQLQAIFAAKASLPGNTLNVVPLDTPLVAPADWPFMRYNPAPPDFSAGVRFCLYNNKWGTNFPMWWDGDLFVRFSLRFNA
ncbi:DUF5054 domain-containing protein [Pelagibacterium limicola]|uniref:DUF5054 domain-containing protein n=1 Tax=Pelagibacterium limicola TaxID=2791022 RepID=UPI0018AFDF41|nr:DUF5054 domain-containing protein [Pelagibacterium limicola]